MEWAPPASLFIKGKLRLREDRRAGTPYNDGKSETSKLRFLAIRSHSNLPPQPCLDLASLSLRFLVHTMEIITSLYWS